MVRAKFYVAGKSEDGGSIHLEPVRSGTPENVEFFKLTPGGSIVLQTVNPAASEQFELGKEYYVDFTPAN